MLRSLLVYLLAAPAAFAQLPAPDAAEQQATVARMRVAVLDYSARLQDFICVRLITRSTVHSGTGAHWKKLETQEGELAYVSHRETYKPVKVNGETTKLDKRVKRGYFTPGGEFGPSLQTIFEPRSKAEFTWDHGEMSGERRFCVFRYNAPEASSSYVMQVNLQRVKLGHHGTVRADCDTGAVTDFRLETDEPTVRESGRDIKVGATLEVHYGQVPIGDREFLLPKTALEIVRFGPGLTKAEIEFTRYGKYDSSSNVTFEPPK